MKTLLKTNAICLYIFFYNLNMFTCAHFHKYAGLLTCQYYISFAQNRKVEKYCSVLSQNKPCLTTQWSVHSAGLCL